MHREIIAFFFLCEPSLLVVTFSRIITLHEITKTCSQLQPYLYIFTWHESNTFPPKNLNAILH